MARAVQQEVAACFSTDSPLAEHIAQFSPRLGQQEMAQAIAAALLGDEALFCEAGTGIGKTMAYLVPVLLSKCQAIISTGTRHLQDQIHDKDLPALHRALALDAKVAVLKGRANYLCLHRLHATLDSGAVSDEQELDLLGSLRQWAQSTVNGDLSEFPDLPENFRLLPNVRSTAENCLGGACDRYGDCFVYKARKRAEEADLVITNHHLLLADMVLRDGGASGMLPEADVIIFDEAHLLTDLATMFFGAALSSYGLLELGEDIRQAHKIETGDNPDLLKLLRNIRGAVQQLQLGLGQETGRKLWSALRGDARLVGHMQALLAKQRILLEYLAEQKERGERLAQCHRRGAEQGELLEHFLAAEPAGQVQWVEIRERGFVLNVTPLDIAALFQERLERYRAQSIYTSATLAAGKDFRHFADQLGFAKALTLQIDTPFRLREQALLYLPNDLPEPGQRSFLAAFLDRVRVLLDYSRGRAFVLFTSHRALQHAAQQLKSTVPWPLLVQGEAPRGALVQSFRGKSDAVLLGTSSFWEGVDIRGEALSNVIIEKLPFASPDDPVMQARIDSMRRGGRNPFIEYQLPRAMIGLKQGVGRLIRDEQDRGVCTICDRRLHTKPYGKHFLDMLSAWRHTDNLDDVRRFYLDAEPSA